MLKSIRFFHIRGGAKMTDIFTHKISLGQNFLKNPEVTRRCIETGELGPDDVVLEVGCGQGVLTRALLRSDIRFLHAVEIDRRLEPWLSPLEREHVGRFGLHWGDALKMPFDTLSPAPNKMLANIPYNITTDLIWKAASELAPLGLTRMILLVQKEAAERLAAPPHSKQRYPLGVTLELAGSVKTVMKVSPGSFVPPPKVWSSLVSIELTRNAPVIAQPAWKTFLTTGFAQRRKKLINVLQSVEHSKEQLLALFAGHGISPGARAEELTAEQWLALYTELKK